MDDDDAMVVAGGGLKIKAGVVVKKSKKDKKKEKKKEKKEKKRSRVEDEPSKPGLVPVALPTMTAAEIKFLEKRRKQEEARLDKASSKSHREKVAGTRRRVVFVIFLSEKKIVRVQCGSCSSVRAS
jgi:hypothetical protein